MLDHTLSSESNFNQSTENNLIPSCNYTMIPNVIFDHWMQVLTSSQFKILLSICRKTFGWHKIKDSLSISQIQELTALHKDTIIEATKVLENLNLIKVTRRISQYGDKDSNLYEINVHGEGIFDGGLGSPYPHLGGKIRQQVVGNSDNGVGGKIRHTKESVLNKELNKTTTTPKSPNEGTNAVDVLQQQFMDAGLSTEQIERAVIFYESNQSEVKSKRNPIGFVVWCIRNNKDDEIQSMEKKIAMRMKKAASMEYSAISGYGMATDEGYEVASGSLYKLYPYDGANEFWEKYGL